MKPEVCDTISKPNISQANKGKHYFHVNWFHKFTDSQDRDDDVVVRTRADSVIKEGVLEKKGNATIQIWAK